MGFHPARGQLFFDQEEREVIVLAIEIPYLKRHMESNAQGEKKSTYMM